VDPLNAANAYKGVDSRVGEVLSKLKKKM